MARVKFRGATHPRVQRILAWAGMYSSSADPQGVTRFSGGGADDSPFDGMVVNPPNYAHRQIYDFFNAYHINTTNVWTEAAGGTGTGLAVQDARGGKAKFTNGTSDNNYYTYQGKYEIGKLVANKGLWLDTTIQIADADEADLFIGLCAKLASGNLFDNRVDSVGFYMTDGSAILRTECNKNSTATQTASSYSIADGTEHRIVFHADGLDQVVFWVWDSAGVLRKATAIKTNLPDDEELAVSFGLRNGKDAANSLQLSAIKITMDI